MKSRFKIATVLAVMLLFVSTSYGQTPEKDDAAKMVEIEKNPSKYIDMGGQMDVVPEFKTKEAKLAYINQMFPNQILPNGDMITPNKPSVRSQVILPNEPTFPVYISTGNKELDDQNYLQKKLDWVSQNQEKYNQMVQPESTPIPQKDRLEFDVKPQK